MNCIKLKKRERKTIHVNEKGNDDATKMLIQHITMLNVTNLGQQSYITKLKINKKKMIKEKVIQHMPTKCNPFQAVEKKNTTPSRLSKKKIQNIQPP